MGSRAFLVSCLSFSFAFVGSTSNRAPACKLARSLARQSRFPFEFEFEPKLDSEFGFGFEFEFETGKRKGSRRRREFVSVMSTSQAREFPAHQARYKDQVAIQYEHLSKKSRIELAGATNDHNYNLPAGSRNGSPAHDEHAAAAAVAAAAVAAEPALEAGGHMDDCMAAMVLMFLSCRPQGEGAAAAAAAAAAASPSRPNPIRGARVAGRPKLGAKFELAPRNRLRAKLEPEEEEEEEELCSLAFVERPAAGSPKLEDEMIFELEQVDQIAAEEAAAAAASPVRQQRAGAVSHCVGNRGPLLCASESALRAVEATDGRPRAANGDEQRRAELAPKQAAPTEATEAAAAATATATACQNSSANANSAASVSKAKLRLQLEQQRQLRFKMNNPVKVSCRVQRAHTQREQRKSSETETGDVNFVFAQCKQMLLVCFVSDCRASGGSLAKVAAAAAAAAAAAEWPPRGRRPSGKRLGRAERAAGGDPSHMHYSIIIISPDRRHRSIFVCLFCAPWPLEASERKMTIAADERAS